MTHLPIALTVSEALTMSSREIAGLCGKRHDHVLRDVRSALIDLYGGDEVERIIPEHYRNRKSEFVRENADTILNAMTEKFGGSPNWGDHSRGFKWERDNRGYITVFQLDKEHALTVVSGYDVRLRKKIIDRWMELEEQGRNPAIDVRNPKTLTAIAIQLIEVNKELEQRVAAVEAEKAEMVEDVHAFDRIARADGSLCVRDAAKNLQIRPVDLTRYLQQHGWAYRRVGAKGLIAYQSKIQQGLMEHKVEVIPLADGTEKVATQARITPKGMAILAKAFPPAAVAA